VRKSVNDRTHTRRSASCAVAQTGIVARVRPPSKSVAARHIARLHTTQSKKPWSRDQQATYYYSGCL